MIQLQVKKKIVKNLHKIDMCVQYIETYLMM